MEPEQEFYYFGDPQDPPEFSTLEKILDFYGVDYDKDNVRCPVGWLPLVRLLVTGLIQEIPPGTWKIVQIKEKFGGLRFYCDFRDSQSVKLNTGLLPSIWSKIIQETEAISFFVCQQCGTYHTNPEYHPYKFHVACQRKECDKYFP